MDKEISLLINLLENPVEENINNLKIWKGNVYHHVVCISKCGIGKVNSAISSFRLIEELKPDLVINSGVAGGAGTPIGSLLVANKVTYNDVWCGPGTDYGQADGFPLFLVPSKEILEITQALDLPQGLICSGDKFISTADEINFIRSKFPEVKAVDMESASIAQTCMFCKVEFAIIRVVSDTPGEGENINQYKDFWATAPGKTFSTINSILNKLNH